LISVIVPVYNVEKYLEGCVRSILSQTYRELEVILVNDGSTDSSLSICHTLAAEDSRIRVLDGPNGGVGHARNRGLDVARGEYVAFVDSDDTIAPDMYAKLLAAMESTDADIAECGFVCKPETGEASWNMSLGERIAETREECIRQYAFFENTATGPCNKLYHRAVVGDARFPVYTQAEDAVFNLQVLRNARCKVTISDCLYNYLQREGSGNRVSRPGHERDAVLAWQEIRDILAAVSPSLCPKVQKKLVEIITRQHEGTLNHRPPNWRRVCRQLKRDYIREYPKQFSSSHQMTGRQKLGFFMFRVFPRFYYWYNQRGKTTV